jgi:hypothetical protein
LNATVFALRMSPPFKSPVSGLNIAGGGGSLTTDSPQLKQKDEPPRILLPQASQISFCTRVSAMPRIYFDLIAAKTFVTAAAVSFGIRGTNLAPPVSFISRSTTLA